MKILVLLVLLLGHYSYAKLPSETEIARIQKVMSSVAQIQKFSKHLVGNGPKFTSPYDTDKNIDDMLKTINQPDCKVVVTKPKEQDPNSSGADIRDGGVEITGEKCSLNLLAEVKSVKEGNDVSFNITFNYESKSPDLKKLIDVEKMKFSGPGYVKIVQHENGMGGEINITYGGTIYSQSEGEVTLSMKQSQKFKMESSNGQMTMSSKMLMPTEIKFSDFQVQTLGDVEVNGGNPVEKYTVNGETVSKEIYDSIASQISIPGTEE